MKDKTPKDWEKHYASIWAQPNNIKFMKPTKRMLDQPTIQVFPPRSPDASIGDVAAAIGIVVALVVVLVLW